MNLLEEVHTGKIKRVITSHSLDNVFDYCARKFEFLTLYDKRPSRESGYAAQVGTALHEGTQAWLIAKSEGADRETAESHGYMAFLREFPWELERQQLTKVRSFENAAMMQHMLMRSPYWDDWELMRVKDHGWAVEIPFVINHVSLGPLLNPHTGEYVLLATQGKIDFILRNRLTGAIRTRDLKTTVTPAQLVRSEYTYSGQQVGYSHVLHAMLGISPGSFDVDYLVARFSSGDPPAIEYLPMEKSPDMIDDYWMAKLDRIKRMAMYIENGWFPRTNGGCNTWGRECSFFDICRSRNYNLITQWFEEIDAEENTGYDWWVELEL